MLLRQSPSIIFAFIFSLISILLTIFNFNIGHNHPHNHIQFLIILPPLNSIFIFLFSLTWIERRFRLSYIPFICLIILLCSTLTLAIISKLFLSSSSIILYFNFIFYSFFTIVFSLFILILIILYLYGSFDIYRSRNTIIIEEQNNPFLKMNKTFQADKFILESNENEFILYMSSFPGREVCHNRHNLINELNQINVDTILTLNETKEFSLMNRTNTNLGNMDVYSMHIKRANMEHMIYPIRNHFIPKSISDYMQFLYGIIKNVNQPHRNRLLIHSMRGLGRTGMTIICLELLYEYMMNDNEQEQKFIERFCHYPLLLENYCRVCKAISNVRKTRSKSIHNPLQILFVHEFYARLKSPSYMQQIKDIVNLNEKLLLSNFDELRLPINL